MDQRIDQELEENAGLDWSIKLDKIINDPWYFASTCVRTKDEVDMRSPEKPFPTHFEYLKVFFDIWRREKLIAIPKSRRMFMSWATLTAHLWDAMWHPNRNIAFVSKKEDDADALLEKVEFILKHIPETALPAELRPKFNRTFCRIEFPEIGSVIQGYPQGADQLRMHTFSRIMADELAFWDKAEEMYSAAIPTLEGGGAMTALSSPAPGFFKRLVFDQLDGAEEPTSSKRYFPMEGVEVWRNIKNKFVVFQLHYSANPDKKDPKYREALRAAMPYHAYMQEYELCWETYSGKPVFPDWNKSVHGSKTGIKAELGLPLILGIDQGLMPACIVCQQQGERMVVLKEYTATNMGAERFVAYVKASLKNDFPNWSRWDRDYIVGMDPSGFNRRDTDERTYAAVWITAGFKPRPGAILWEPRKQAVEKLLTTFVKGHPTLLVDLSECPLFVRGLDGGYRYPDKSFEIEPNKARPIKDENSHVQDAFQYAVTVFGTINQRAKRSIPAPSYAWSKEDSNGRKPTAIGRN